MASQRQPHILCICSHPEGGAHVPSLEPGGLCARSSEPAVSTSGPFEYLPRKQLMCCEEAPAGEKVQMEGSEAPSTVLAGLLADVSTTDQTHGSITRGPSSPAELPPTHTCPRSLTKPQIHEQNQ